MASPTDQRKFFVGGLFNLPPVDVSTHEFGCKSPVPLRALEQRGEFIKPNPAFNSQHFTVNEADMLAVTSVLEEITDIARIVVGRAIDSCLREALGQWVSELDPVLVFAHGSPLPVGLTAPGHTKVYVRIVWRY